MGGNGSRIERPALSPLEDHFKHYPNAAISGFNLEHLKGYTVEQCMQACIAETNFVCKSFDYRVGENACDLSHKTLDDVGGLKTDYVDEVFDHYARVFPEKTR